jgi:hypothetical protein
MSNGEESSFKKWLPLTAGGINALVAFVLANKEIPVRVIPGMESLQHGAALLGAMAGTLTGLKTPWWVSVLLAPGAILCWVGYRHCFNAGGGPPSDDYLPAMLYFGIFFGAGTILAALERTLFQLFGNGKKAGDTKASEPEA